VLAAPGKLRLHDDLVPGKLEARLDWDRALRGLGGARACDEGDHRGRRSKHGYTA
jgi:hypothetical protein